MRGTRRHGHRWGCGLALAGGLLLLGMVGLSAWRDTLADPVVRRAALVLPGMPAGARPLSIVLFSDTHPGKLNMPLGRLARIVNQVNALHPDIVVAAGDFISDGEWSERPYPIAASIAPLGRLRAPLGVYAVTGNHDHWNGSARIARELAKQRITVLDNSARQVGPLVIAGLDDAYTGHARLSATLAAMRHLRGGRVIVSHSPDPFARLPAGTGLMLAGHTHCGQIRLFGWAPITNSRYGQRYVCGLVRERGNTLIVSAGLGTSVIPVRLGARADIWLIEVRPARGATAAGS